MNKALPLTVGIAVITHNAKKHLPYCLPPYLNSPLNPKVLVVNSSSHDGTVELAKELRADTLVIPRADFNHGSTRELARNYLSTDIIVMTTPDAYASCTSTLEQLIYPLVKNQASVAYARQLPHKGSKFFESFAREYNYSQESHIRGIEDIEKYGVYTFFCSNSCAAYNNRALSEIGGFKPVLLGEDTVAVAKLLKLGHKIAYVAEAKVHHSHSYSLAQEFHRCFDIGLARQEYGHLLAEAGKDQKRGKEYTKIMLNRLWQEKPQLIPYALMQTTAKWVGYTLGRKSVNAPKWLKKMCSSQDFYWK